MKSQSELEDDLFQLGQQEILTFPSVSNSRSYDHKYSEDANAIMALYIRYDTKFDIYNRKVYSILELLGDIGGL